MAIEIKMSSQVVQDTGVKILVYGEAGMGKTSLVATLPKPILISAESGLLSIAAENLNRVYGNMGLPIVYDIPVIEVKCLEDVEAAYQWCVTPANQQYFESIALDSLSEIAEQCLNNAKKGTKDPRQAYGTLLEKMQDLIRKFRDIPGKHVYMSAKMGKDKDEVSGVTAYAPSMPGSKLGQMLPYFFDEVFRLNVNKDQQGNSYRYLQTQPDFNTIAKDRSGRLDAVEVPHLGSVINKMKGIN
jgi:phage nucleotide-binding protein